MMKQKRRIELDEMQRANMRPDRKPLHVRALSSRYLVDGTWRIESSESRRRLFTGPRVRLPDLGPHVPSTKRDYATAWFGLALANVICWKTPPASSSVSI